MKAQILLATLGAAVLTTITFSANAGEALLTPRAAGNQIKNVPAEAMGATVFTAQLVAPRALGNQTKNVAGTSIETTPATACVKRMTGSPKAIQACSDHPATMPGCNVAMSAH
ncbi:MAG TPA: hypothetical protein VMB80_06155 [Candidatus Acidoferrum sp.]|nr:hypothetical protein [Candidatus Acidoferrum sp.]